MLTGQVPFPRENDLAKLWAHISDRPPSALELAPDTPPGARRRGRARMAKDPADRFETAGKMGRVALASVPGRADTGARARMAAGRRGAAVEGGDHPCRRDGGLAPPPRSGGSRAGA